MPLSLHSTSLCHLSDEAVERELKIVQNKLLGMAQMKALASESPFAAPSLPFI